MIGKLQKCKKFFQIFHKKGLKNVSLQNQFELDIPIWDSNNRCLINYILKLLTYMKNSQDEDEKVNIIDIYTKLGKRQILLSPYT